MAVYVDNLRNWGGAKGYRWKKSCHMYADTLDELHQMAARIGMKSKWFQDDPRLPHYDLHPKQRELALARGVIQHTRRQMTDFMKQNKEISELLTQTHENHIAGLMTNGAWASNSLMTPTPPLTVDSLMATYRQFEKLAQDLAAADENVRRTLREHMGIFVGAPWEVIRAASMLAYANPMDIHPNEYKRAQNLVLAYLEDLSNASTT